MQGADGQVSVGSFVYGGDRVNEEWRPIPGYEGYYEASTAGRIRSVDRMQTGRWGEVFHPSHKQTQEMAIGESFVPMAQLTEKSDV